MSSLFFRDDHPGKPRILFVGLGESTHTHAWIDLLESAPFNVRLFAMPSGVPPDDWGVRTYVTSYFHAGLDPATRAALHPPNRLLRFARRNVSRVVGVGLQEMTDRWLAEIIRGWRPDIIHTLGLEAAGEYFYDVRRRFRLERIGRWVLQIRGGSDIALARLNPVRGPALAGVLRACDQLLCDNPENFRILRGMGVREEQFAKIGTVPGTGGVDVAAVAARWQGAPSQRRTIMWPKVYESPWAKVLPVYEALKLCWERIQPCEVEMLSMNPEAHAWYWTLPAHMRERCHARERIPRERVLELMTGARVMLAPSLVDGVPNSLYEAMAAGAFPIVSPLDTIRPVVEEGRNVLFARNLYPEEIAGALVRAMTDGALVDGAAQENLALVRRIAERAEVRARITDFYESLAARP
jgi:glycosyltransferase involved in cell wall biosynthesis